MSATGSAFRIAARYRRYYRLPGATRLQRSVRALSALQPEQWQSHVRFDSRSWAMAASALAFASLAGSTAFNSQNEAAAVKNKNASEISSTQTVISCEPRRINSVDLQPRNVMLHRMRSVKGRGLNDKYNVEWDTVLGEGAYGFVHPARLAVTGEKVALKKISRRYTDSSAFMNEIDALLRIYDNGGHPNISGLRDSYEDQKYYYLILDLVSGGEMFEHLINFGAYSEADAARLMHEVASALAFLHGVGVVHADLKPENLLLSTKNRLDGTIKIIDFGCAVVDDVDVEDDQDAYATQAEKRKNLLKSASSTGTTAYWPPERFDMDSTTNAGTDMWSVGVILYIMLTGVHPFDVEGISTDEDIKARIKADPRPPLTDDLVGHLSESAIDLILKLMEKDPTKRLSAYDMLQHPWVRGETASKEKMQDSDKKLSTFKDLRYKLEASMFAVLVSQGYSDARLSEAKVKKKKSEREDSSAHIMKRAFDVFDLEGKGFVTSGDLGRVASERTGSVVSSSDTEQFLVTRGDGSSSAANLSLSQFNKIFSGLHQKHFPRGHYIFHAGDPGDAMYFLSSGKVEIQTRKGQLVALLRSGDFFGEGSLLEKGSTRYTAAKCATPVDVYKIQREDFDRYMGASLTARQDLRVKWRARSLAYAKNLLRLQENVKVLELKKSDVVYREGDLGTSMFRVDDDDDERGGELAVSHGDNIVHKYVKGDSFGESSLLFKRPRSSTVTCVSDSCRLHVMNGADFLAVVDSSPEMAESLRNMCRKRLFKKAVKNYSLEKKRGLSDDDIVAAFHDADIDRSGSLSLEEVRRLMHQMDPQYPLEEIQALLKWVDIDEDGQMTLEEFKRLFRQFEDEKAAV
jgi:serine/threonine protein kinase/CRP-like cAMP-binding protein